MGQVEAFILAVERNEAEEKAINNKLLHFFDELCSSASFALTFKPPKPSIHF